MTVPKVELEFIGSNSAKRQFLKDLATQFTTFVDFSALKYAKTTSDRINVLLLLDITQII